MSVLNVYLLFENIDLISWDEDNEDLLVVSVLFTHVAEAGMIILGILSALESDIELSIILFFFLLYKIAIVLPKIGLTHNTFEKAGFLLHLLHIMSSRVFSVPV